MSAGTLLPHMKVSVIPLTRSNRAYVRFEDAWTFPPYSQSNTLVNASVQNIGSPWVQDLISIFDCWERIGVRQEEMEFEKYKLVFPTAA